ncbi:hypothetical protein AMATHDRAFT_140149 [Amanita thiersii Skay4041]|uniref:DNA mismatch repair protein MSH3 n=1 Tax=Amanita thiersii Skay4041 TaxID=703135 RepID=A0A2A9NX85_9AGAR|nr:hypothetical protein AMATHDRAFT_140149 [Amanita thiersii Skay4041]
MKQKLHEAFKKKLLQGDESRSHKSLASSGRFTTSSGLIEGDEDEDDSIEYISPPPQQEIEQRPAKRRKHAPPKVGPSGQPYTPLELQVLKLKKENPGPILMVEVGYKYKFFGEDAKVARKELGMVAFVDRNFLVASIPTHRRDVHLKKLLSQGYRVGIVNQIETAALKKASDNRNAPFERRVTNLYTAATYVDNIDSVDDSERYMPPILMCLIEEPNRSGQCDVNIGLITVCPSTGDVVWDDISDTPMRIELETRLAHMRPAELLLPESGLSEPTAKLLTYLTNSPTADHKIRVEHLQHIFSSDRAFDLISDFYTEQRELHTSSSGAILAKVVDFPKRVTIALAHAIKYLSTFGIASALLETTFFERFTTRAQMLLTANTLTNLEIYRNETDYTINGSLLWVLDNTKTRFGARMLKHWVGRPLADKRILQERIEAVEEILESSSEMLHTLRDTLKRLPDLARGLCRIQYGQCTPQELATIFPAFRKVANAFQLVESPSEVGLKSVLLSNIIFSLPRIREPVIETLGAISLKKALEGEKEEMWTDPERYPAIDDAKMAIQHVEAELEEELKKARRQLRLPSLQWTSVAGDEYIIEVKRSDKRPIPDTWTLHSKTKYLERYRPLEVIQKLEERARYQETLQAEACNAYRQFLAEISSKHYTVLRAAVTHLAMADCLICFAHVALRNNYVRPEFMNEDVLEIVDGRHPMIEELRSDPFVPNSVKIGSESPRNLIITGPNMGGKSSCVRMVALIAIMAQIGSYVPAASLRMSLLDSVLTRMGASDDLAKGRSTFMVEMSETRDILYTATKKSLVILDELGRGTSTFDGMAIADAVLHHLVETTKCKTLFITHYPLVASSLERRFPKDVENLHMDYQVQHRIDGTRDVTFLYRLAAGIAPESFGVECGRLAGLPESVLSLATSQASNMQAEVTKRMRLNRWDFLVYLQPRFLTPSLKDAQIRLSSKSLFVP